MTGRELIMWILENHLEDKVLFDDGEVYGFTSIKKAAAELEVGEATVKTWMAMNEIAPCIIGGTVYISIQDMLTLREKKERFKCVTK